MTLLAGKQYVAAIGLSEADKAVLKEHFLGKHVQPQVWATGAPQDAGTTVGYYFRDNEAVRAVLKINFGRDRKHISENTSEFLEPRES